MAFMMQVEFERILALFILIPLTAAFVHRLPGVYWLELLPAAVLITLIALSTLNRELTFGNVTVYFINLQVILAYPIVAAGRAVGGFCVMLILASWSARYRSVRLPLNVMIGGGLLIGMIALTAVNWTTKSAFFEPLLSLLPQATYPILGNNINVNEIGGALAWFTPLLIVLTLYAWGAIDPGRRTSPIRRWMTLAGSILCISALMLGQSRFAIAGVIAASAALIWLFLRGRSRQAGLIVVVVFVVFEALLVSNVLVPPEQSTLERDQDSVSSRLLIWESALAVIRDYPLTGAGLNAFRAPAVRERYPVEGYEVRVLPHAHNELLQVGADMGLPGIAALLLLYAGAGWSAYRAWKYGETFHRVIAAGVIGGLGAHFIYGLGDAITLWDRLTFGMWLLLGMGAAVSIAAQERLRRGYTPQD